MQKSLTLFIFLAACANESEKNTSESGNIENVEDPGFDIPFEEPDSPNEVPSEDIEEENEEYLKELKNKL